MAEAIFVSEKIYNFSELMEQSIFLSLKNTPHEWIYELISAYNQGSYPHFKTVINKS